AGVRVGAEFLANANPFPGTAAAAFIPGGGFVVAWTQYSDGSQDGVDAQRFDAGGAKLGGEFRVNTTVIGSQQAPALAAGGGGFVVVWTAPQDGDQFGVVGQRFDAVGGRLGGEFVVNAYTTGSQLDAHVTGRADGGFLVTWTSSPGSDGSSTS